MKVLVIDGHPRADSLCAALVQAYVAGARDAGHEVAELRVRDLEFDPNYMRQSAEDSILMSRMRIQESDHLVFVHPVWWGSMPSKLKGWMDHTFQPGFAFENRENGGWTGLLHRKRATILLTMDTPAWVFRWILHAPALRALRDATLGFCGITTDKTLLYTPVKTSTTVQRERWLEQARDAGARTGQHTVCGAVSAWLQAMRPQFYIFPWMALSAGALCAAADTGKSFQWLPYVLAWFTALLLEFASVLTNEIHDAASDQVNRNFGPFTGGSRVQVNRILSEPQLKTGRWVAAVAGLIAGIALALTHPASAWSIFAVVVLGLSFGIGYTAPPLRLSYRSLGEVDVGITHSAWVVIMGWLSQGAPLFAEGPWVVSLPMFFSILPAITLAGLPDLEADAAVEKRTIAVRFGRRVAAGLAGATAAIAAVTFVWLISGWVPWWISCAIVLHTLALVHRCIQLVRHPRSGRLDGPLALALSYMVWFALGPLIAMLS